MSLTRNQIIIIGAGVVVIIVIVLIFTGVIPGLQGPSQNNQQMKLTAWGIDDPKNFQVLVDGYNKLQPNVKITYTQVPEANYENALISALAAGTGPDVFMFHSSWTLRHNQIVYPAPSSQFSIVQLEQSFPRVVEQDFSLSGATLALPLYVDTMALLYNKDIFDAKSIAIPPSTWQDFQNLVPVLRTINQQNQIVKAAAAIGGSATSIDHAGDLVNNIIQQSGNPNIDSQGAVKFDDNAIKALNFYLQFSNPESATYTWNDSLSSLDSFSQGNTAIIFDYDAVIPGLKSKNPFLSVGVLPMPQLIGASQPVNVANYWGFAVSKQSSQPAWAWDFIINTATNSQIADGYLQLSHRPPALRSLVNKYLNDAEFGVFARQALTARSWHSPGDAPQIFSDLIQSVLSGRLSLSQALGQATNQINGVQ